MACGPRSTTRCRSKGSKLWWTTWPSSPRRRAEADDDREVSSTRPQPHLGWRAEALALGSVCGVGGGRSIRTPSWFVRPICTAWRFLSRCWQSAAPGPAPTTSRFRRCRRAASRCSMRRAPTPMPSKSSLSRACCSRHAISTTRSSTSTPWTPRIRSWEARSRLPRRRSTDMSWRIIRSASRTRQGRLPCCRCGDQARHACHRVRPGDHGGFGLEPARDGQEGAQPG